MSIVNFIEMTLSYYGALELLTRIEENSLIKVRTYLCIMYLILTFHPHFPHYFPNFYKKLTQFWLQNCQNFQFFAGLIVAEGYFIISNESDRESFLISKDCEIAKTCFCIFFSFRIYTP